MKILLTGGAGFVGSNIYNALKDEYDVWVVDNLTFGDSRNIEINPKWLKDKIPVRFKADFNDLRDYVLNSFDILIHCATINIEYAMKEPIETFKVNALNTIKLFERFKGKIIYTSTASVYGNAAELPTKECAPDNVSNAYDQSKLIAEHYLQLRGNYTTLRLSNVYGINQRPDKDIVGVVGKFVDSILNNKPVTIYGDGKDTRDYTYVSDVVRAVEMCVEQKAKNKEYNISGGDELSIMELANKIAYLVGTPIVVKNVKSRKIDKINRRLLDTTLAQEELGWHPLIGINKGLEKTIFWQRKEYR